MAGQTGQPTFDITDELIRESSRFSFLQAIRLLRLKGHVPEAVPDAQAGSGQTLRIRPPNTLSFPAADVASVEKVRGPEERFVVNATFLGLYGPSSPLPTFYTEDLIGQELADETAVRDFLDIFNHRLFTLFFRCSMKYRLFFRVCEENDRDVLEKMFCLLGLGEGIHRELMPQAFSLLRYSGILSQHPRSAWGLETMLSDAFGQTPIRVRQCVRRWVRIPSDQRFFLGEESCTLGEDSVVGERIEDYTGKFLIRIGPVPFARFQQFLPGHPENKRLALLTHFYLQDPLEYDIELILKENETSTVRVGGETSSRLGLDTWVFSSSTVGEVRTVFPMQ